MRQHYCGLFVQPDEKSDGAICTNDLISVSLKSHRPIIYTNLLTSCKLTKYLADIDKQAEDMFFRLVNQLAKQEEINEKLSDEIDVICKTLDFSSKIVKRRKNAEIIIEPIFVGQNKVIDAIIQTIDRDEGKKFKNSIVSIRSYLDRVIGESLN